MIHHPHAIGMYRLEVLKQRCKMEMEFKSPMKINTCASVRKEFSIPGRSRKQVVDFLQEYITNILHTGVEVDHYGHPVTPDENTKYPDS